MTSVPLRLVATYSALLVLLALTLASSTLLTGAAGLAAGLAIAAAKIALIYAVFIGLPRQPGLIRLAATAAALWLLILTALTFTDYLTR